MFLFKQKDRFQDGYKYADKELKSGIDPTVLYKQADNAFDFDDFDRGILAKLREVNEINL